MIRVSRNVGRLIEAFVASPITVNEAESTVQQVRLTILGAPAKAVCCIDATGLTLMPDEVSEAFVSLFTRDNPKVECSAFLIAKRASGVGLQLGRMLRQAGHPARRSFDDRDELEGWVGTFLAADERAQLGRFLRSFGGDRVSVV